MSMMLVTNEQLIKLRDMQAIDIYAIMDQEMDNKISSTPTQPRQVWIDAQ